MPQEYRSRRSCLAVPGSSQRFLDKARGLAADEVFLDLEDAVAPAAKEAARRNVIAALNDGGWGGKLVAVRVNDATTRWAYRDVAEVVAAAGRGLDAVILPKVTDPGHVVWLDLMLGQIEQDTGDEPGRIGIEAQIEDARGLAKAAASTAALGYDGKWVLHPTQIEIVNSAFAPSQEDYERAELIIDAYRYYTSVEHRGAVDARRRDDR